MITTLQNIKKEKKLKKGTLAELRLQKWHRLNFQTRCLVKFCENVDINVERKWDCGKQFS